MPEARRVLQCFVRVSPVLSVVAGGREVGTTGEHPFYVSGRGWVPAGSLRVGDRLVTSDGREVAVEAVRDANRIATVYNCKVKGDHTYFVGSEQDRNPAATRSRVGRLWYAPSAFGRLFGAIKQNLVPVDAVGGLVTLRESPPHRAKSIEFRPDLQSSRHGLVRREAPGEHLPHNTRGEYIKERMQAGGGRSL